MPKKITKLWVMIKIDGADMSVRQCNIDDSGNVGYGEAIELTNADKAKLNTVARALAKKLEE